jgi:hypothetical protein
LVVQNVPEDDKPMEQDLSQNVSNFCPTLCSNVSRAEKSSPRMKATFLLLLSVVSYQSEQQA